MAFGRVDREELAGTCLDDDDDSRSEHGVWGKLNSFEMVVLGFLCVTHRLWQRYCGSLGL